MKEGIATEEVAKKPAKVEYDPNKRYTWKPTDTFYISGNDFGILLNGLRSILSTPEARTILLADRASEVVETILARSVEAGISTEIVEEKKK